MSNRPALVIIGPSPPPYNGMSIATELLRKAIGGEIAFVHLDTADRRGLANVGRLDLTNIWLAVRHSVRCLWILLTKRPQVVYVQVAQAWLAFLRDCLFLIPARLLGRKVIVHLHGGYFGTFYRETSPLMRQIIRFALGGVVRAIVLGRSLEDVFKGVIPAERIGVVPNGIPDYFSDGVQTARVGHPPTLLFLSTLMEEKGTLDLLRALPRVRERAGNVRAVFAGEWYSGRDKENAERIVAEFRIGSWAEFAGPVGPAKKKQLLETSDVLVFPTRYPFEGHPYVVLEAMAAGLPVISTKWACIPEMVEDGVNGFLIEPGDVDKLAEKICAVLSDGALRRRMGEASRERFLSEFTFDIFAERMRGVFAEVLNGVPAERIAGAK